MLLQKKNCVLVVVYPSFASLISSSCLNLYDQIRFSLSSLCSQTIIYAYFSGLLDLFVSFVIALLCIVVLFNFSNQGKLI